MGCSSSSAAAPTQRFADAYGLGAPLGRGSFGHVLVATQLSTGAERAVKVLPNKLDEAGRPSRRVLEQSKAEVQLWRHVGRHKHCVQLLSAFYEKEATYLVMERCRGSMKDSLLLVQNSPVEEIARVLREICLGLKHLHSLEIVHRDIKPENLLFGGEDGQTVKICDFGVAVRMPHGGFLSGACGTVSYMSPEMVRDSCYDDRTDCWSVGVVAYQLLFRALPYSPPVRTSQAIREAILQNQPPLSFAKRPKRTDCPLALWAGALQFLEALLQRHPAKRQRMSKALELPFLHGMVLEMDEDTWDDLRCLSCDSTPSTVAGPVQSMSSAAETDGSFDLAASPAGIPPTSL